jgi:hypothetical protein
MQVFLARQPVRLDGKFFRAGGSALVIDAPRVSPADSGRDVTCPPSDLPDGGLPATATGPGTGPADTSVSPMRELT